MSKIKLQCFDIVHKPSQPWRKLQTLANSTPRVPRKLSFPDKNGTLGALSKPGSVDDARAVFDQMPEKDVFAWNAMISAYAEAGRLDEARQLFDKAPKKSAFTWSTLLSGYSKHGLENEGFELFRAMQRDGKKPTGTTLASILRICSAKRLIFEGEQVHSYSMKTRFNLDIFVATGLVEMYVKCMRVAEAESVFNSISTGKNHVTWTSMICGYSQIACFSKAIDCFRRMRAENVKANQYTFPGLLSSCSALSDLKFGVQVHSNVLRGGFGSNLFVQSALVDMYAKCGDLSSARKELESMSFDHIVSWNAMMLGCVNHGFPNMALSLFKDMVSRDMDTDNFTYPSVINSLALLKDATNGKCIHCSVIKTGYDGYRLVANALVDMYAKQAELVCAREVFEGIMDKDVVSWTSLVTGYAHNCMHEESLKLFREMMSSADVTPDPVIFSSVLSSCAEIAVLDLGRQIHARYMKSGLTTSASVDNTLVAMYANCGSLEDADRVFDSMRSRSVITWTARIIGYAQNGRGEESVRLYDSMICEGIEPDVVAFIGLLFACSRAGLVELGRSHFESMEPVYGIKPGPNHYACMTDLLARAGKTQEAMELAADAGPDATVWKALLSACGVHGDVPAAEKAAAVLFELNPEDAAPYVMMSNIYSAAGRWDESSRVRGRMRASGARKERSYSWIETNGAVHKFLSGDRDHPKAGEVFAKVEDVLRAIEEAGYVPDMNCALHDINDEGRRESLAYHSEKLAVAFGLLYVPEGAAIRVYKNLRVCGDCHAAMKFISKVFQRHIILRDSNYFHHFRLGTCSCRDYW
ncbi:unnamed protein product [Cuscuta campestris]|uniref:DYW domain-containing protein n=1 Tax=Cuscuta campestris TaxID=132261 RepID=A0A484M6N9_9ASTE|nr:unnamed protein product [Cuscuta campestris]